MKRHLLRMIAAAAIAFSLNPVHASHLVGGNLGYTYLGETSPGSGLYRYEVYLDFFMNCGPNSNFPTLYDLLGQDLNTPLLVGAYFQDPLDPNGDKVKLQDIQVFLTDSLLIEPDLPDGCTVGAGLCTVKGRFTGQVDIPLNFGGIHLYYHMCCRNLDISNLNNPNGTGIGYYAFVPPPLVNNSSPIFLGQPTPFLCIADTATFLNTAVDPDGDLLIFSFEVPYNSQNFAGGIIPPPPVLDWPIGDVTYNPGFSLAQPFGAGGYSFINGATGLTQYQPPLQGNYVVAVEVKEYRNGIQIGRIRRDLQLQAIVCPPNATPQASTPIQASYTVQAGAPLCIDFAFLDADGDSLILNADGSIFDGGLFNPPATIGSPVEGDGSVATQFCWNTACDQGQDQPYLFSVSVTDNGCPPLTIDVVVQVQVQPFLGSGPIFGPATVCTGTNGAAYTVPSISGANYQWTITGGTQASGGNTNSITVDWGAPGTGTVSVVATDTLGCNAPPVELTVVISPEPDTDAGPDLTICAGDSVTIGGSPTGPLGSTYTWSPAAGLSATNIANPDASPASTTTYIVQVSNSGCIVTDTMTVTLSLPQVDAGANVALCLDDTVQLNATGIGAFAWSPATGLSATNIADPLAFPTTTTEYFVTLTDSVGCVATDSVLVAVNVFSDPLSILPDVNGICEGDTVGFFTLLSVPGYTYSWTATGGTVVNTNGNTAAVFLNIPGPGSVTLFVTDTNGCVSTTITENFTVIDSPDADAGPDQSICPGGSANIGGSPTGPIGAQTLWFPALGLNDSTLANPTATPSVTTTYIVSVIADSICVSTDTVIVFVSVPPANAGPDVAICNGGSVQLNAAGGVSFLWSPPTGLSDVAVADPIASPTITTTFTVQVTDSIGCTATDDVTVTVNDPPDAGTDGSITVCSDGVPVDLFSLLGGSPDQGGTWIPGPTYTPGAGGGIFTYVLTAIAPCVNDSSVVVVTENTAPDAGSNASIEVCSSTQPFDLFDVLGGTPDAGGIWTDPFNNPFSGIFDPSLFTGTVTCTYTVPGSAPCVDANATVTIAIGVAADPGADASVSLCSSGIAFNLFDSLGGAPELNGIWTDPLSVVHGATYDPATDEPGAYTYTIAGAAGCPDTSATVTVTETAPTIDAGSDIAICIGDTTQLAGSGGPSYLWSPASGLSAVDVADPLAFPSATITYALLVTDGQGCFANDSVTVTVNALPVVSAGSDIFLCVGQQGTIGGSPTGPPGSTFIWAPGTGLSSTSAANPLADPTVTTTYVVGVQDVNGCIAIDTVTVNVNALPSVSAGADTSICTGSNVQLDATGSGTFVWTPATGLSDPNTEDPIASPSATTTYTVTLTDSNDCSASDEVTVSIGSLPTVDAGSDVWVCPGFDVQLQASGAATYTWSPTTGLNDPNISNPLASPVITTVYTVTGTDAAGCDGSDQVTVTVNDDPPVDAGPDQVVCLGNPVQIGGAPTSLPGSSFTWTPGAGLDDATLSDPIASPLVTTVYTVTVLNDTCTSSDDVLVTIANEASVGFTMRWEARCDGLRLFITDLSAGAVSYLWTFSDGSTSTEEEPSPVLPYGSGVVTVSLTITDAQGCTASVTQSYPAGTLEDYSDITFPNVFTPNGDGDNDLFGPIADAQLGGCLQLNIFNRWGQKMFESLGNSTQWDGRTFAGEAAVMGTYFYVVDLNGMRFEGSLELIR
ncbi:MAG: gliding motility-associated C-terminal domain-containing protein [Flavobacteriales bacterium]|nr:gliding motility-associated C-terminal domain-containing protein [Flavobacteriales bacterium]